MSRRSIGVALVLALSMAGASPVAAATSGGWTNLGTGATATTPPVNGKVLAILVVGTKVYIGGDFTNAGGLANADRIAVWNASTSTWSALGSGVADGAVSAIAVYGTRVFVGGSFTHVGPGGATAAKSFAVWNGSVWGTPGDYFNGPVWALTISGTNLIIAGAFSDFTTVINGDNIVAYDLVGGGFAGMNSIDGTLGTVFAVAPDGSGGAYVGGYFAASEGVANSQYLIHWLGATSWTGVGGSPLSATVRGLAADGGGGVYVVGDFLNCGGVMGADRVAHWDGVEWTAVGTPQEFNAVSSIYGVALDGPNVVVAGTFLNAGANAKIDGIAVWDGAAWRNVGTNAAGTNGPGISGRAVAFKGRILYFGGLDGAIGGGSLHRGIASFRIRQPDVTIATTGAATGTNVTNATGSGQTLQRSIVHGKSGTFTIAIANRGAVSDTITFQGSGSTSGFATTWKIGTTDITAQVVAGVFARTLAPGAKKTLTLTVKIGPTKAKGSTRTWTGTATSTGASAPVDRVIAKVLVS